MNSLPPRPWRYNGQYNELSDANGNVFSYEIPPDAMALIVRLVNAEAQVVERIEWAINNTPLKHRGTQPWAALLDVLDILRGDRPYDGGE